MDEVRGQLPPVIEGYVRRFALRRRRLALARRVGLCVAVAGLAAFIVCLVDRVWRLSGEVRGLALAGVVAVLVVPVVGPLVGLFGKIDSLGAAGGIERRTGRFRQKLVTLVSQYMMSEGERGSGEFLGKLAGEVEGEIGQVRVAKLLPWTRVAGPWFLVMLTGGLVAVGWRAEWLGLPRLAQRLVIPMGGVGPVTTTKVLVSPGTASVVEGEGVTIRARVWPAVEGEVMLRVDGVGTAMARAGGGVYEVTVPRVERGFTYLVEAGDAVSAAYAVEVLRRPVVSEVRVTYAYPAYARREPVTVVSRDGIVEAPAGTKVTVRVVGAETLRGGALVSTEGRVELTRGKEENVVEGEVAMTGDRRYQVELVSERGVVGQGVGRVLVRTVADRGPAVRMVQPVDDLRLDPKALLPVGYEAVDDVGVDRVMGHVRVNNGAARDVVVVERGEGRRVEGIYDLDLAGFELKVGDVVAVSVSAADGLGQVGKSDERHVLITPRTIDIATYQRVAELKQAAQVSGAVVSELEAAQGAVGELAGARAGADRLRKLSALNQHLAGAAEAESALRRAVTAAVGRSNSARLSVTLGNVADQLAVCTWGTARAAARVNAGEQEEVMVRVAGALEAARGMKQKLGVLALGQQAAATLADRSNLRSAATLPTTQATAERVTRTLDRARADVTAAAAALGMDVNAPDLDAKLQQLVDAAEGLMKGESAVDYGKVMEAREEGLAERLEAAAAIEAARVDADVAWVADLQSMARVVRQGNGIAAAEMAGVMRVLQGAHKGETQMGVVEARGRLRRWSGEGDVVLTEVAEAIDRRTAERKGNGALQDAQAGLRREQGEATGWMDEASGRLSLSDPNVVPYAGPRQGTVRGVDVPGYEEALGAYFRAIAKEGKSN